MEADYIGFLAKVQEAAEEKSMDLKAFGHKIKRAYSLAEERDGWRGICLKKTNDQIGANKG